MPESIKKIELKNFLEKEWEKKEPWMTEDYLLGRQYILNKIALSWGIKIKKQCSVK